MEPNDQQRRLINNLDGIYLVDAGAGTGKTFAVTRRYANLLQKRNVDPEDVLLVTFTNHTAEEMKKKVIQLCDNYRPVQLRDAPISTFHSLCHQVINNYGFQTPQFLGIQDGITSSTNIIENEVLENQEFNRFINRFINQHPEYRDYYRITYQYSNLLNLIKKLASKGIFPTRKGWYQNGEKYLNGNFKEFQQLFEGANQPRKGGSRQSELRSRLVGYKYKCFPNQAPETREVRGIRCKQIPNEMARKAFQEDRDGLKRFVHDVYYEYIRYALDRNYLNFGFLMMFAYVLLCEDHNLRRELGYEYVMIDEFQDTSEIQLKLALLLANRPNICAVGDWKQSIYSFQYADVDNIRKFQERLERYRRELNQDHPRIDYPTHQVTTIPLKENYRSTQKILDFSEQSLTLEATKKETLNKGEIMQDVTHLQSKMKGPTTIQAFKSEEEKKAVLEKIQEVVGNPEYPVGEDQNLQKPTYSDIVVLTRTSQFALKLQKLGRKYGLPLVYEGGTELFKTDPAIILLAWLRILNYKHSKRGWAVILEKAGYNLDEVKHILDHRDYPENMLQFRKKLESFQDLSAVTRKVFHKYGISNVFSDKIIEVLQNTFQVTYMNLGRLIQFIEDNIQTGTRYEVDNSSREDVVKIRTIHAEKGLEHPIVFISDINQHRFPNQGRGSGRIDYKDPIGLRQKKIYQDQGTPYIYDNWKTEILHKCLTGRYNEERRLMYVAMTRAQRHLFLTAEVEKASQFFQNLNIKPTTVEPELEEIEIEEKKGQRLEIEEPSYKTPIKRSVTSIIQPKPKGRKGEEYGNKVHRFAEQYATGKNLKPENPDEENIKKLLDSLKGKLITEEACLLPLKTEDRKIVLKGYIDLIHLHKNRVEIYDYKTDKNKENHKEYQKQLSAYYQATKKHFKDRTVSPFIFYTDTGQIIPVEPLTIKELKRKF